MWEQDELLHMDLGYESLVNLSQALRKEFPAPAILYGNCKIVILSRFPFLFLSLTLESITTLVL